MKVKIISILIVLIAVLFSSCSIAKSGEKYYGELFSEGKNEIPSWNGIIPNYTSYEEAIDYLNSIIDKNKQGDIIFSKSNEYEYIKWKIDGLDYLTITTKNSTNLVLSIKFKYSSDVFSTVIDNVGNPEYMLPAFLPDTTDTFHMNVYYPEKGLIVSLSGEVTSDLKLEVTPKMKIIRVVFIKPGTILEMLKYDFGENIEFGFEDRLLTWQGYGLYDIPKK